MFFFKRRKNNPLLHKQFRLSRGPRFSNPRRSFIKKFVSSIFVYINIVLIAIIGYFIYFFIFSTYFNIDNIEILGNDKISSYDLQKLVTQYLDEKRFYILPNNNLLLFSGNDLKKKINENFIFNSINIDRESPNTLKITINEKEPRLQFSSNEKAYLLDENGLIIQRLFGKEAFSDIYNINNTAQETDYTDFSYNDLPLIYNQANDSLNLGQYVLDKDKINKIWSFIGESKKYSYISISRVEVADLTAQYLIITSNPNNWRFYLNFNDDPVQQLKRMDLVIKEKVPVEKLGRIDYFDLRMGENVYYKMK